MLQKLSWAMLAVFMCIGATGLIGCTTHKKEVIVERRRPVVEREEVIVHDRGPHRY